MRTDAIALNSMRVNSATSEAEMNLERDIHPLTDFKRHTAEFLTQLKTTGQPVVLTINGKAEIVAAGRQVVSAVAGVGRTA